MCFCIFFSWLFWRSDLILNWYELLSFPALDLFFFFFFFFACCISSGGKSAIVTNTTVEIVIPEDVIGSVYGDNGSNLSRLRQVNLFTFMLVYPPLLGTILLTAVFSSIVTDFRCQSYNAWTSTWHKRLDGHHIWNTRSDPGSTEPPPSFHSKWAILAWPSSASIVMNNWRKWHI